MASVGTLRPAGLRRRLPWALGLYFSKRIRSEVSLSSILMIEKSKKPPQRKMRTAFGLLVGALVAAVAGIAMEMLGRNIEGIREDPFTFSALVPLVFGVFSCLVFLPIVCAVHSRARSGRVAIWLPTILFSVAATAIPLMFPGKQPSLVILGISTFITVAIPLSLSTIAAVRIWRLP